MISVTKTTLWIIDDIMDRVVFGSPSTLVVAGQMRLFLDRCYSLINADFSASCRKKSCGHRNSGAPDAEAFKGVYEEFKGQISNFMDVKDTIVGIGYHARVKEDTELMEKAKIQH